MRGTPLGVLGQRGQSSRRPGRSLGYVIEDRVSLGRRVDAAHEDWNAGDARDDVTRVTQLDQAWNDTYAKGDRAALADILSDDFFAVAPTGSANRQD